MKGRTMRRSTIVLGAVISTMFCLICFPSAPFSRTDNWRRGFGDYMIYHSRRGWPFVFRDTVTAVRYDRSLGRDTDTPAEHDYLARNRIDDTWNNAWFVPATYERPIELMYLGPVWFVDGQRKQWGSPRWRVTVGRAKQTSWLGLAMDLAIGILAVMLVCGAFEARQRRRNHLLQIRITDLLGIMLVVALLAAWWKSAAQRQADWAPQAFKRLIGSKAWYHERARSVQTEAKRKQLRERIERIQFTPPTTNER